MALNPSNGIAARNNPGKTMLPNLAKRKPDDYNREPTAAELGEWARACGEVDAHVQAELTAAGIPVIGPHEFLRERREVPAAYLGQLGPWGFRRAWYYWVAEGPGVPPDVAEAFHADWGTQVRVNGHCGCPSPLEQNQGFAVGMYHIDTQEGLTAFAALLRGIWKPREEEE